ncbi:MAG: hypothetical protein ACO3FI_12525 [Cyclobacteriaceae bacterium]
MKSSLKTSFAGRSIAKVLFVLASMTLWMACTEDSGMLNPSDEASSASSNSTSRWGDYNYNVEVSDDGTKWTYTISKVSSKSKNLSHFIIDLQNCGDQSATFANLISATVNGQAADIRPNEGQGTGCDPYAATTNFVKINFPIAASTYVIVITFDSGYDVFAGARAWQKAGTSCNIGTVGAPGCPKGSKCSFSQGFFFANGSWRNDADVIWEDNNGLTIGGYNYSHDNGTTLWETDKGKGGDQTLNAFFQLGAVRLSGTEASVSVEDVALIDKYFELVGRSIVTNCGSFDCSVNDPVCYGLVTLQPCNKNRQPTGNPYTYVNLPASVSYTVTVEDITTTVTITKAEVQAAGSRIGAFIDANHCP